MHCIVVKRKLEKISTLGAPLIPCGMGLNAKWVKKYVVSIRHALLGTAVNSELTMLKKGG